MTIRMQQGVISVIVPVYNVEKYLDRCVESLLHQTYEKLEIILVDDGSTDNSGVMCDEYAARDGRIKVIHKENGGLSDARNAGMEIATGEYIGFVDSDDWAETDMYERLCGLCRDKGLDIVAARFCEAVEGVDRETAFTGEFLEMDGRELLRLNIFGDAKYVVTNSVWDRLYRRELLEGIVFPVGRKYEDIRFTTQVFLRAKKCGYLDAKVYHYTIRDDSIMGKGVKATDSFSDDITEDLLPQMKDRAEFLLGEGYKELGERSRYNYLRECLNCIVRVYGKKEYRRQQELLVEEYKSHKQWMRKYCSMNPRETGGIRIQIANYSISLYVRMVKWKRRFSGF